MKTYNLTIIGMAMLLFTMAVPTSAQVVSNDNEDEVYKIDKHFTKDFVPGQVLVKMKDGNPVTVRRVKGRFQSAGISKLDKVLSQFGVEDMEQLLPNAKVGRTPRRAKAYSGATIVERDLTQLYKLTLAEEKAPQTLQLVDELKTLDEVEFAEPNYRVYLTEAHVADSYDSNPLASQQWYLDAYGVKELWNKPIINAKRPVIAILDTGVDLTHPDLVDNLWTNTAEANGEEGYDNDGNGFKNDVHGWDFINNTPNIRDNNMHGTHVAGIAAAANNGIGIVGANPQALIMAISVMQSDGTGDVATIIKGINYAAQNGADVLNLSLGTYANSQAMRQALGKAYQTAVIVAAAGNDFYRLNPKKVGICSDRDILHCGMDCDKNYFKMFPAAYSFVLGVQASTSTGELAPFSNHDNDGPTYSSETTPLDPEGFNYELMAPGTNMLSTIPGGKYRELNGTSMASPLVAGAISALKMVKEYNTQEILWGDLLHSSNIAEAYNITERPASLDFLQLQFRDRKELEDETEEDYSNDGRVDAGETISIYPVIRTSFGEASNIKLYLEMGDEFEDPTTVEILTDENNKVDFGWHLDAYGKGVSANPLKVKIANNVADNRHIKMKIVATCDESTVVFERSFTLVVDNIIKIHGFISEDMTLTADHVYYIDGDMAVLEGATLTIEPGTTIQFQGGRRLSVFGTLIADGTPEKPIIFEEHIGEGYWRFIASKSNPRTVLRYCKLSHFSIDNPTYAERQPYYENCVFSDIGGSAFPYILQVDAEYCNIMDCYDELNDLYYVGQMKYNNIVNNVGSATWSALTNSNFFNAFTKENNGKTYYIQVETSYQPVIIKKEEPPYLGTAREDLIRPHVWEYGNLPPNEPNDFYAQIDLSNMPTRPYAEAHGIVWKVLVDGIDPQDEYEIMPPLGVGKHKFEVYFNRPMNKAVAPIISFGVREPYTQQAVAEDGSWNADGTIYTAYKTITGKTKSDGICRIYVYGAEDTEFFEIPYEKTRFEVNVQAAGSMATGFMAEAGLGRVNLTWNNDNNDFDDAMGFNIYRFGEEYEKTLPAGYYNGITPTEWGVGTYYDERTVMVADTIRINQEIVDIETTKYTDYDVTPGETYHYYYKVLSTALQEYDVSNVVAATPLTSSLGDANGDTHVDVTDVMTTVNYALGMDQKPFIFEAADVNTDKLINVLDVIGIVQLVLNPSSNNARAYVTEAEPEIVYSVKDGMLYLDTPVEIGGFQVQLSLSEELRVKSEEFTPTEELKGFEVASSWLTKNDYRMMAYSFGNKTLPAGKHAVLYIGNADITSLCISDAVGNKVNIKPDDPTSVEGLTGRNIIRSNGVFNLQGQKVSGEDDSFNLQRGVYIINGKKVVK